MYKKLMFATCSVQLAVSVIKDPLDLKLFLILNENA